MISLILIINLIILDYFSIQRGTTCSNYSETVIVRYLPFPLTFSNETYGRKSPIFSRVLMKLI